MPRRYAVLHMEDSIRWERGAELCRDALMVKEEGEVFDLYSTARAGALPALSADGAVVANGTHDGAPPSAKRPRFTASDIVDL
jgi:hypothetical protein